MSHVVVIKTAVKDAAAVRAACQRLGLPQPVQGTTDCSPVPPRPRCAVAKWRIPSCVTPTPANWSSTTSQATGATPRNSTVLQSYAVEKAKIELVAGKYLHEQQLADGSIS